MQAILEKRNELKIVGSDRAWTPTYETVKFNKRYSIKTTSYMLDENNNKCVIDDKIHVIKNNGDALGGKIKLFKEKSLILEIMNRMITVDIDDIAVLEKV